MDAQQIINAIRKIVLKLYDLRFIFIPWWWIMNHPYSCYWDQMFNKLMDEYDFTNTGKYTAKLGVWEIWIANYPYATFHPYGMDIRPSRSTIKRARKKYKKDIEKQMKEAIDVFLNKNEKQ